MSEKPPGQIFNDNKKGFVISNKKTVTNPGPRSPFVEFRPGENNETAKARDEEERVSQSKRNEQFFQEEGLYSPEDRQLGPFLKEIRDIARMFKVNIDLEGKYSETLSIKPDGEFDDEKRLTEDGAKKENTPPYIVTHNIVKPEQLYKAMQIFTKKFPEYKVSFETDPNGQWLKYTVK